MNIFTKPFAIIKVGTVKLSSTGTFAVSNAKSTYNAQRQSTVTTTTLTGKFKNSKLASGRITFFQTFTSAHGASSSCGPGRTTFTAKTG